MSAIDEDPAHPEVEVDLEAIQSENADMLDGDSDRSARKALLQALIADVRVESRDAITPTSECLFRPRFALCPDWLGRLSRIRTTKRCKRALES